MGFLPVHVNFKFYNIFYININNQLKHSDKKEWASL